MQRMIRYDGQKLKRIRLQRGMYQTQVAHLVGLSQPTVSLAESGQHQDPVTFRRLADFYGVELHELMIEEPDDDGRRAS